MNRLHYTLEDASCGHLLCVNGSSVFSEEEAKATAEAIRDVTGFRFSISRLTSQEIDRRPARWIAADPATAVNIARAFGYYLRAADIEADRTNEREMWGPAGRPRFR